MQIAVSACFGWVSLTYQSPWGSERGSMTTQWCMSVLSFT
jgi:hypothetical protein